jgi:hypothetical protein
MYTGRTEELFFFNPAGSNAMQLGPRCRGPMPAGPNYNRALEPPRPTKSKELAVGVWVWGSEGTREESRTKGRSAGAGGEPQASSAAIRGAGRGTPILIGSSPPS